MKYDILAIYNEQNLYKITVLVAGKSEMRVLEFTFFLARYPIEDQKKKGERKVNEGELRPTKINHFIPYSQPNYIPLGPISKHCPTGE